jgi:hypothetical protein
MYAYCILVLSTSTSSAKDTPYQNSITWPEI